MMKIFGAFALVVVASCGGGKSTGDGVGPGSSHEVPPDDDDLDVGDGTGGGGGSADAGVAAPEPEIDAGPPKPPVTFALSNTDEADLVFSMDKGWAPVIFAFSGKPPKAVSLRMFAEVYTASCDAPEEERCPKAPPRPEKNRDEMAAEKRETLTPGGNLEVPWDGLALTYEKTKAGGRKCECYRTAPAAAGEYTVRACGLRKISGKSKLQCIDQPMVLPEGERAPLTVDLVFPTPPEK